MELLYSVSIQSALHLHFNYRRCAMHLRVHRFVQGHSDRASGGARARNLHVMRWPLYLLSHAPPLLIHAYSVSVGSWRFFFPVCVSVCSEGVCEIWLTSEDTGAYGRDIGTDLPTLLWRLVEEIPEGAMLRLGMTNPPYILEHLEVINAHSHIQIRNTTPILPRSTSSTALLGL